MKQHPRAKLTDDQVRAMRADEQEQELYNYLLQEAHSIVVRSLIKAWSEKRQRGEV